MRLLLLAFWLGCFGILHAATGLAETGSFGLPFAMPKERNATTEPEPTGTRQSIFTMHVTPEGRHLYSTLYEKPERVFKGEIFSITLRSIVTAEEFKTLQYRFSGGTGMQLLNDEPEREYRDHAFFDRFFFKATGSRVVLPEITPYVTFGLSYAADSVPIRGEKINVTVLNPPKSFSGILADRFGVTHTKTTVYDQDHNIVVFMADANRSDLGDFRIRSAKQQNFESLHSAPHGSTMTYYAVVPDSAEFLAFDYFNLQTQRYEHIRIPIEVDDDLVSTMSDLKPVEHGHDYQKAVVFGVIAVIFFLAALWKRSLLLLLIAVSAGGYAAWLTIPMRKVCINEGASIYLLPMRNATVFEITPVQYELEMQGHIKDYTKVRLLNNKIGWVKDEDTCAR